MMKSSNLTARVFAALSQAFETLDDGDLIDLLKRLEREVDKTLNIHQRTRQSRGGNSAVMLAASLVMGELSTISTREEAADFLEKQDHSRSILTAAAKLRDIHVARHDTNATIRMKLIENVVGSRLDAAAIRGS